MDTKKVFNSREKALLALEKHLKTGIFLDVLLKPFEESSPDFRLTQRLAYGACQRAITLDYMATKWAPKGIVGLSFREKALLRIALYEALFLEGIPRYATVHEMVELAKKKCHLGFSRFLNALLRKVTTFEMTGNLSIDYSIPMPLLKKLESEYEKGDLLQILEIANRPAKTFARRRGTSDVEEIKELAMYVKNPLYYIQNPTTAALFSSLVEASQLACTKILDLCSAPGGKLLLATDFYKQAALFACEKSRNRLQRLQENIKKYGLSVVILECPGEDYPIPTTPFDLVIADVPCSNTGVLNKRPEARFHLETPCDIQKKLLDHAVRLGKAVFYMTCSLLREENEEIARPYNPLFEKKIIPDFQGGEGGYGAYIRSPYF